MERTIKRAMALDSTTRTGVGSILWILAASLPWLLPTHDVPWTTFQAELCIALVVLALFVATLARWNGTHTVDAVTVGLMTTACVPLLQAGAGLYVVPSEAPLIAMVLVGAALTAWIARIAEERSPANVVRLLFASFVVASVVSSVIGILQWLRIDPGSVLVAPPSPELRAVANVGQPNNLATLLVWGLVGLWWLWTSGRLVAAFVVPAAALLLFGVVLTVSRAGLLQVVLLAAAAWTLRRKIRVGSPWTWVGLGAWFVIATLALGPLTAHFVGDTLRSLADMASPRERTMLLRLDFAEIEARPWFGWGWNQNIVGHVALSDRFPMHGEVGNAHNLILDLLIWNGAPLGLLLTAAMGFGGWQMFRRQGTTEQTFCKIALLTFSVHCMLELPHVLAYFLFPAALMAGTLTAHRWRLFAVPRVIPWLAACGAAVYLVALTTDYLTIEENLRSARMRAARIAGAAAENNPPMRVLGSLQNTLFALRLEPVRGMSSETLDAMRRAATRFPAAPGLLRYAWAAGLNGQPQQAAWALGVLCALYPEGECANARAGWVSLLADGANPELTRVVTPWKS